jgi:hypothetical protein
MLAHGRGYRLNRAPALHPPPRQGRLSPCYDKTTMGTIKAPMSASVKVPLQCPDRIGSARHAVAVVIEMGRT